jgi:hypothetical protein
VTFTPWAAGSLSAVLVVTDNASSSPQIINSTGTGVQPTPPGTYSFQVGAVAGYDEHILNISVVVQ